MAREYCAGYLRSLGFSVAERPFEFSALPGRYGAKIIGVVGGIGVTFTALMHWRLAFGDDLAAFGTLVVVLALVLWFSSPKSTREPLVRERGVNLEAVRGEPKVWLVAHIDSKSQPISSALRTAAVVLLTVGVAVVGFAPALLSAICGIVGGGILARASVGDRSDGAADNASGVAAVLDAVAQLPKDADVGVLITDAEELALAGATGWVSGRAPGIAINCDTVDDEGSLVIMRYGSGRLTDAATTAARAIDPAARVIRPLPGVLTDSVAFRRAKWQTVTLSRGTIRTLNRVHTERDSLAALRGAGIPDAARLLARLVEELN